MLVLSRKPGEKLHIGDNVTITIVKVRGDRVRIGIDAPSDVRVVRSELNAWNDLSFGESVEVDLPSGHETARTGVPARTTTNFV